MSSLSPNNPPPRPELAWQSMTCGSLAAFTRNAPSTRGWDVPAIKRSNGLHPQRAKYPWVGCLQDDQGDSKTPHANSLFMAADSTMITVGGGDGQAIWMDENIRFGKTDRCSTFNNPPLCPSGDFEIRVLEVYGFSGA
ncbi:hypothetical protein ACJJTC_003783 [Scirpophaga incertulas]